MERGLLWSIYLFLFSKEDLLNTNKTESNPFFPKRMMLFVILGSLFVANALIAEFIGVKIFSLEKTFGISPLNMSFFGTDNLGFNLTAGVLLWPVIFVLTDIINEYYGMKGVKILSIIAAILIVYAFVVIFVSIGLEPAEFWRNAHILPDWSAEQKQDMLSKVGDYNIAYRLVFGQGLWIIIGSLVAFLIGQFIDVIVFHRLKKVTGESRIWLRATGSTLVSQFIDSYVVLLIAFYIGAGWPFLLVFAIGTVNYIYKFVLAIVLTPVIYFAHSIIDNYLGKDLSNKMKFQAQL